MKKSEIISQTLKSLVFPKRCIFCGDYIFPTDKNTCQRCMESLPYIKGRICSKCGCERQDCSCSENIVFYDKTVGALYYEGNVKSSLKRMKFNGKKSYARCYAEYMYQAMRENYLTEKFDFIAYVPLYKDDLKYRGYNQSESIANRISEITGLPVEKDLIVKIYKTEKQSTCNSNMRTGNILGVFSVTKDVTGCSILLIDDIKTTGSTLSECAKMLRLNGAENICCLCAAVSKKEKKR